MTGWRGGRPRLRPADWLEGGRSWPSGPFRRDAPPLVLYSAAFVTNLVTVVVDSGSSLAGGSTIEGADVGAGGVVAGVLAGEMAVTLEVVERLEAMLAVRLWPTREQIRRLRWDADGARD